MRIRNSLRLVLAVPISVALLKCSSVKQEKGPFNDNGWVPDYVTGTGPGSGTGGAGGGTGGAANGTGGAGSETGGATTGSGTTGSGGATTGAGGAGTGGAGAGAGAGGSGIGGAGACQTFDYKNYQPPAAAVSFKNDVIPLLREAKCTNNGCHSDLTMNPPGLGPSSGMPDANQLQAMQKALVAQSVQTPALKIVAAGKPEESYLMNKIDGTFNCMGFDCKETACGQPMPSPPNGRLEADKINKIRAWIKQGALNN